MKNKTIEGPVAIVVVAAVLILAIALGLWYANRPNPALKADLQRDAAERGVSYGRPPTK